MNLDQWGFTHWFDRVPSEEQAHLPTELNSFGRITGVHRKRIDLQTAAGFETVDFQVANKKLQIAVGDWVVLDTQPDKNLTITTVCFRTSLLSRIASGPRKTLQPLASNVDHVFILAAMDRTFNVARMERFLAAAWASGIEPVLVLTRADLVDTAEPYEEALRAVALDTPIITINAHDANTIALLRPFLAPNYTNTMIGLSGAGKSTLTNTLAGDTVMTTQPVRAFDDKGRHTTTRRQMIKLTEDRGLLIDSPGVREMQIYYDAETISRVFYRIEEASMHCKYSNCRHDSEGDCAVKLRAGEDAKFRLNFEKYRTVKRMAVSPIPDY